MRVITNTNKNNNRMLKLIIDQSIDTNILIASAFFTESDIIKQMIDNKCNISLIIRLGIGTSPKALKEVVNLPNINIRFFTGRSFHPKFYIFGNRIAYVGSSNLTKSGLTTNQEVNVEIDSEEPIFTDLFSIFNEYWISAEVLTEEIINKFAEIESKYKPSDPFQEIYNKIGEYEFNNVGRDKAKIATDKQFILNFRKNYQEYITKFNLLKNIYNDIGERRFGEIPLRIEVDRFLWWIREFKANGESYKGIKIKSNAELEQTIPPLIKEFIVTKNNYLENEAVPRYFEIKNSLKDENSITGSNINELINILINVHAFHDTLRFFEGGLEPMKNSFLTLNGEAKIKNTISWLLFGSNGYENRIYSCIHEDQYKLAGFGESCVKELFGLINDKDIPICNGRTLKSLEWLGFGKL